MKIQNLKKIIKYASFQCSRNETSVLFVCLFLLHDNHGLTFTVASCTQRHPNRLRNRDSLSDRQTRTTLI